MIDKKEKINPRIIIANSNVIGIVQELKPSITRKGVNPRELSLGSYIPGGKALKHYSDINIILSRYLASIEFHNPTKKGSTNDC